MKARRGQSISNHDSEIQISTKKFIKHKAFKENVIANISVLRSF